MDNGWTVSLVQFEEIIYHFNGMDVSIIYTISSNFKVKFKRTEIQRTKEKINLKYIFNFKFVDNI